MNYIQGQYHSETGQEMFVKEVVMDDVGYSVWKWTTEEYQALVFSSPQVPFLPGFFTKPTHRKSALWD